MIALKQSVLAMLLISVCCGLANCEVEVRIKDISSLEGERTNVLNGMGIVTGLNGTGGTTPATRILAASVLQRLGQRISPLLREAIRRDTQQKTDNVSVVLVSAELPVNARPGQRIDAVVSAYDDALSISYGVLLMTPMYGVDGKVYATAQGRLSNNALSFSGDAARTQKNHPTVARLHNQVTVEAEVPIDCVEPDSIRILLHTPDWDTTVRITEAINRVAPDTALPENSGSVLVQTPIAPIPRANFIRLVTGLRITPDVSARVVINERTGTVTLGQNVKLSRVVLTHGNISVVTGESPLVSQPTPFSDGETTVVPRTEIDVVEERNPLTVINDTFTVGELAGALNALGVSPIDLSAILQQLRAAGALHAEIELQ